MEVPVVHEEWSGPWEEQKKQAQMVYHAARHLVNARSTFNGTPGALRVGCDKRRPSIFLAWRLENSTVPWVYHIVIEESIFSAFRQEVEALDLNNLTAIREIGSDQFGDDIKVMGSGVFHSESSTSFVREVSTWRARIRERHVD